MRQGQVDCGLEKLQFVAGVVAATFEFEGVQVAFGGDLLDAVGQPDLATLAGCGLFQVVKNIWCQHVAGHAG